MCYPMHVLLLTTFLLAPLASADEKPAATHANAPPPNPVDAVRVSLTCAGYSPVPINMDRRMFFFYVDGRVGTEKVRFQLDSGIWETELDLTVAKRLNLKLGEQVPSIGAGGSHVDRQVEFPSFSIGAYDIFADWKRFEGLTGDLSGFRSSPAGLLGMGVLERWAAVVDYPSRTLYLRPTLTTAWPRLAGTWTVMTWQQEGHARMLDSKVPPTFTFADHRLKLTDGSKTRDYAIRLMSVDNGVYQVLLFDPKKEGKPDVVTLAGGLIKIAGGRMTACLALDVKKAKKLPPAFDSPKGSGYVLLALKRSGPEAPDQKPSDPLRELLLKDGYTAVPLKKDTEGKRAVIASAGRHALRLLVDTGANFSTFDSTGIDKWAGKRRGEGEGRGFGGSVKADEVHLRGLTLAKYNTRRAWAEVYGFGIDLSTVNKYLLEEKLPSIHGVLGNLDLLNGSAVIDFGTNTLYLRPVKQTIWPQLEGKWVAVRYAFDGRKGQYKLGDAAVEFKGGRVRFITPGGTPEWGFHLRDEGDRFRLGLFDPKADELAEGFKYSSGGLLKLTDGKLTLVMEQGVRKEPTEFAAPAGSGLLLVEYKRAK